MFDTGRAENDGTLTANGWTLNFLGRSHPAREDVEGFDILN